MYASNFHSYTHLIRALGIVRDPSVWVFITSQYPGYMTLAWLLCVSLTCTEALAPPCYKDSEAGLSQISCS